MSDEITIPELNTITTIQEDDAIMLTHSDGVTEKIAAANLTARDTFIIAATPTVTGPTLGTGFAVRILFTAAITGLNTSSALVINYNETEYTVKVAKDGQLVDFVAQEFTENNATVYKYLQAYTVLELIYNGSNFVIVGNPIVFSGSDFKIYADGSKYKLVDEVAVDNINSVTSNAVAAKFNTVGEEKSGSVTSGTYTSNGTFKSENCGSITLTKGKWIVIFTMQYNGNMNTGYVIGCAIDNESYRVRVATANIERTLELQCVGIVNVTSSSRSVDLRVFHHLTVDIASNSFVKAIRIQ